MQRIACLHTAASNVSIFDAAGAGLGTPSLGGELVLHHVVRADLLDDAEAAGGLTPDIEDRTIEVLLALASDADAVVLTCSTLGPAVKRLQAAPVPVLRVDEALARQVVRGGGQVVVLCAVATTLGPTRALFERAALETGAAVDIRLVPGAWTEFKTGETERYLALIAEAAEDALIKGASHVALAQASMAGAERLVGQHGRVLSSPAAGLRAALGQAVSG